MDEWSVLFTNVGGPANAGTALKTATGWKIQSEEPAGNFAGKDTYGFGVLPGGYRDKEFFSGVDKAAYFWSSTQPGENYAYGMNFSAEDAFVDKDSHLKVMAFSVRCLKGDLAP